MRRTFHGRAVEITLVLGWAMLRFAAFFLGQEMLRVPGTERDERHIQARGAAILRQALERLGATFIKLGQVMSTRPDLFGAPVIAELKKLQDRLPGFAGARAVIEAELGENAAEIVELDPFPIAAASVAQVHQARLANGDEVAIKVLRPDVRAQAEGDGEILLVLARLAEKLSDRAEHAQLEEHLQHFLAGILEQADLRIEAANYERFRHNFRKRKKIRFPKVYPALSGERVLTMSFVRGRKVDEIARGELPDLPRLLREAFLQMCFDDGLLHADLHPGNFLIQEDGGVTIFDVGLAKSLGGELLEHYIDFNRCLVMGTVDDFMRHLRRFHSYVEGTVDWAELERDMRAFHAEFLGRSAKDLEFGQLIDRVFAVGRKHGVRPVPDMTLMMVGLVTAEGIGKALDPDVNSFQEVANYLLPVLARRNLLTPELIEAASQAYQRAQAAS